MAPEVLTQGHEPERPPLTPRVALALLGARGVAVLLAAVAVLAAGSVSAWQWQPLAGVGVGVGEAGGAAEGSGGRAGAAAAAPQRDTAPRRVPRIVLARAGVVDGAVRPDGVLRLRVRLEGVPQARLLSLRVDLPGSAVVLDVLPDALSPAGVAQVGLEVLPRCPQAADGLSQAGVIAVVRAAEGARARPVRVRLDTAGFLADVVRARCDPGGELSGLTPPLVQPAGDGGAGVLPTQVALTAVGRDPVTVVGVRPGPGLAVEVTTALPVNVAPGAVPALLRVDLQGSGCGGAPDSPPYLLELSTGQTVAPSVAPALRGDVDALRPYRCTAP